MTRSLTQFSRLWSIILAGNEPSSLDSFVTRWQGSHTPKQFCAFVGTRSLLQHTWDLVDRVSHPENKVTVVTQPFLHQTCRQLGGRVPGLMAIEPFQKGSLSSALLGLAVVHAQDPQSTIVLCPSRSFVYPEHRLLRTIQQAVWASNLLNDRVVLFGVHSDHSCGRHGWLRTTEQVGLAAGLPVHATEISPTSMFPDDTTTKNPSIPPPSILVNSGIVVAKAEILWNRCQAQFPEIFGELEKLECLAGQPEKRNQKSMAFQAIPSGCFWKDFLSQIPNHLATAELQDVTWSDWEKPGHIVETLSLLGRQPTFPVQWSMRQLDGQLSSRLIRQEEEIKT